MEEQRVPKEDERTPEEEYSFLQEVIKDEMRSGKKLRSGIMHMIGMGFIFGLAASFTFYVARPWMESRFWKEPSQVTIPRDEEAEEEEQAGEKPSEEPTQEEEPVLNTESYRQMLQSLKDVAKETEKSIVEITGISAEEDWEKELNSSQYSVAGAIVADNGQELLLVGKICPVKDVRGIRVTFAGGDSYEGTEKTRDGNLGLAVYAVPRGAISEDTWTKIDTAVLGNSNLVSAGETAIVLGKPLGDANCYTYGIVSTEMTGKNLADGQYGVVHTDIAGTADASGVIVNVRGEVIGIVEQTLLEEESRNMLAGYGISDMKGVIEKLSNGQSVPYVGIYGVDVTEDMQEQGLPGGMYVKEVEPDSPAMTAGIQNGDVITGIGDTGITALSDYHDTLMAKSEGQELVLKGCRQGTGGEYVAIDFKVIVGAKK